MTDTKIYAERFNALCANEGYVSSGLSDKNGIGVYNEKRLHQILKHTLCCREDCYEIKIGRYIADICDGGTITEIQCGPLAPLRDKLAFYLADTEYSIRVVHPLIVKRRVIRADSETGEVLRNRLSPKKENYWDALASLYPISEFLTSRRISVTFMSVEVEEYRFSERMRYRRRGAYDNELFPTKLIDAQTFCEAKELARFIPAELADREFSAAEFARFTSLRGRDVYSALNTLSAVGLLERRNRGRNVFYEVCKSTAK